MIINTDADTDTMDLECARDGVNQAEDSGAPANQTMHDSGSAALDHPSLPDIAVVTILKNISDSDPETILNSRLICRQWNKVIENTSDLMRKITFPIWHPKPFLDLNIVQRKKVKSIRFICPFYLKSKYTNDFVDLISNTVEKVDFAFEEDLPLQEEIFNLVLEKCTNLRSLVVSAADLYIFGHGMYRNFTADIIVSSADKINVVSFRIDKFGERESTGLGILLLKLPRLTEINLIHGDPLSVYYDGYKKILVGLCEYLKKFGKNLCLKKLYLPTNGLLGPDEHAQMFISLLILCGKYLVVFDDGGQVPELALNSLLALNETIILPTLLDQRPLFKANVAGRLTIGDSTAALTNLDRLHSLNIPFLRINFKRDIIQVELSWIAHLQDLGFLLLCCDDLNLVARPNIALEASMSLRLPKLPWLIIYDDIFGSVHQFPWLQCFPSLRVLKFYFCKLIHNDIIMELTALETLTSLEFQSLPNLEDTAFTVQCENRFATDNDKALAPAIACFKQLECLHIASCNKLTNECLINGISKIKTLQELKIESCENIRQEMVESVTAVGTI